jgi:hypothetical protein
MNQPLPPAPLRVPEVTSDHPGPAGAQVATRDHALIRQWAQRRNAEPATGEATASGAASAQITDGGAGIRFNFPAITRFRPITWDEWFANFEQHGLLFLFENDRDNEPPSPLYRLVKAADWNGVVHL